MYPQMQLHIGYSHHFKTCPVFNLFKHTLTPQIPGNYQFFFCLCSFDFSRFLYNWNHKYIGFSDWLLSFSDMHLTVDSYLLWLSESESESCSVMSDSLWPHGLYGQSNSPGQNTGMGSLSLFQGIFPTQGLKPGLPHCRQILYQLSHQGNPRILEWVAYLFSSGSSWPRNWTWVSSIAGGFFTNWATRKSQENWSG